MSGVLRALEIDEELAGFRSSLPIVVLENKSQNYFTPGKDKATFTSLLKRHWDGIMGYYQNHTTPAAIEAVNTLLQLARRRARSYRRFENFRAMAYWIAGRLELRAPRASTH